MPTQIIDGFKLNALTPIDSRMVTSGTASRNNLAYKYEGLRVFDIVQKQPYVFIDGKWQEELVASTQASGGGGVIGASGKNNYIPKFNSTGGLTNSVIREASGGANTWIGINVPINSSVQAQLHVGGSVCASSFLGNISGGYVLQDTMPLNRLQYPQQTNSSYVLKFENGAPVWGSAGSAAATTNVANNTISTATFLTFVTGNTGELEINTSCANANKAFTANLSTSQMQLSNENASTEPPYSFIGAPSTGLYGSSAEVGVSLGGTKRVSATSTKLEMSTGGTVNIEAGPTYNTLKKNTTVEGNVNISGVTTVTNKIVAQNIELSTGFKLTTSGFGPGRVLVSDASGNGSWGTGISLGVSVGTIIIFLLNGDWTKIPAGWKPCVHFATSFGNAPHSNPNLPSYKGQLYMNGSYMDVPDMRDRVIMGATDMQTTSTVGSHSPSTQAQVTLNWGNMAPHKHAVSTSNYYNQANCGNNNYPLPNGFGVVKVTAQSTSTFKDITDNCTGHNHSYSYTPNTGTGYRGGDNRQINFEESANTSRALISGRVTTYTTLDGYTDDGSTWLGGYTEMGKPFNIPHEKKQIVVFLIKIDPNAAEDTEGFYKIVKGN